MNIKISTLLNSMMATKNVSGVLERNANNFDLLRLIAALFVIYGHSYSTSPDPSRLTDIFFLGTGYYSAGIAVKFFFFLSGVLVTDSLLKRASILHFLLARFFRIWPALLLLIFITAFVVGPLLSTASIAEYFGNINLYLYIKNQLILNTWGHSGVGYTELPGLFLNNPYKGNINASLWTLPAEIACYLFILSVFIFGLLNKKLFIYIFLIVLIDSIYTSRIIFLGLPIGNEDFSYLPFCFLVGAFIAVYKDRIKINFGVVFGCLILLYFYRNTAYERHLFYVTVFFSLFYIGSLNWVIKNLKLPCDISYGVYLWGFLIQQILALVFPDLKGLYHCILTMFISVVVGLASWHLVERRSIDFGRQIFKLINKG